MELNRQYGTADAPDEARLKYRGVEYSIDQIGSGVWKWSASVDGVSNTGLATSESEAVAVAKKVIDRLLAPKKVRLVPPDKQKKRRTPPKIDAVYDDDSFVRCKLCGSWINTRNPSSLLEHRGPLPHPRIAGAEWIDDDD